MYFAGKTYFQGENLQVVEEPKPKPKPRRKGDVAKKGKKEGKIDIAKLKKQFGNDIIMMLLLKLLGNDKKEKKEPKEKKPKGMRRAGRGGGGGGGGFQTQKSLQGQRAVQNKQARLNLVGQQKETETDPEYLKRILKEVLVDDPVAGAFVDGVVPRGEGDSMPQTAPAFKDTIGQLVKYQDILRKGTFEGKALTKKKRTAVERSVIRSLEQVAGEVSDKFITTSKDKFIGRGVEKAIEVLRTIYGPDYKPPDGKDYDVKVDDDGSIYSEDRFTKKRGRGRPRKETYTDSSGSSTSGGPPAAGGATRRARSPTPPSSAEVLRKARRAADTINEANKRDADIDSSVRSDDERSVEFYQEISQRRYNKLDDDARAKYLKSYVSQLPKGLRDGDEQLQKYTKRTAFDYIDSEGNPAEGVVTGNDPAILEEYKKQGKQSRRGLKKDDPFRIPPFGERAEKSLAESEDLDVSEGFTTASVIQQRIREEIIRLGGSFRSAPSGRKSRASTESSDDVELAEKLDSELAESKLADLPDDRFYDIFGTESASSAEQSGSFGGIPVGSQSQQSEETSAEKIIRDKLELQVAAKSEAGSLDISEPLFVAPKKKPTFEEHIAGRELDEKVSTILAQGKSEKKERKKNLAYDEIDGIILSVQDEMTKEEFAVLKRISQKAREEGKASSDTIRKINSRIEKIGRGETIKELKDPKKESMKTRVGAGEIIRPVFTPDGSIDPAKFVYLDKETGFDQDNDITQDLPLVGDLYASLAGANKEEKKRIRKEIDTITRDYTYQLRKQALREQAEEADGFAENDVESDDGDFLQTPQSNKRFVDKGLDVSDDYKKGGRFGLTDDEEVVGWGEKGFKVQNSRTDYYRYIPSKPLTGADKVVYETKKQLEEKSTSESDEAAGVGSLQIGDAGSEQISEIIGDGGSQAIGDGASLQSSQGISEPAASVDESENLDVLRGKISQDKLLALEDRKKAQDLVDEDFLGSGGSSSQSTVLGPSEEEELQQQIRNRFLTAGLSGFKQARRSAVAEQLNLQDKSVLDQSESEFSPEDLPLGSVTGAALALPEQDPVPEESEEADPKSEEEKLDEEDEILVDLNDQLAELLRLGKRDELSALAEGRLQDEEDYEGLNKTARKTRKTKLRREIKEEILAETDRLKEELSERQKPSDEILEDPELERAIAKKKLEEQGVRPRVEAERGVTDFDEDEEEEEEEIPAASEPPPARATKKLKKEKKTRKVKIQLKQVQKDIDKVVGEGEVFSSDAAAAKLKELANRKELLNAERADIERGIVEEVEDIPVGVGERVVKSEGVGERRVKGKKQTRSQRNTELIKTFNLNPQLLSPEDRQKAQDILAEREIKARVKSGDEQSIAEVTQAELRAERKQQDRKGKVQAYIDTLQSVDDSIIDQFEVLDVLTGRADPPEAPASKREREIREAQRGISDADAKRVAKQRKTLKKTGQYTDDQIEDLLIEGFAGEQPELVGGIGQTPQGKQSLPRDIPIQGSDEDTASFEAREAETYKARAIEQALKQGQAGFKTKTSDLPAPQKSKKTISKFDGKIKRLQESITETSTREEKETVAAAIKLQEDLRRKALTQQQTAQQELLSEAEVNSSGYDELYPSETTSERRERKRPKRLSKIGIPQEAEQIRKDYMDRFEAQILSGKRTEKSRQRAEIKSLKAAEDYIELQEELFGFRQGLPFSTRQGNIPLPANVTPTTNLGNYGEGVEPAWVTRNKELEKTEAGRDTLEVERRLRQIGVKSVTEQPPPLTTKKPISTKGRGKPFVVGGKTQGYLKSVAAEAQDTSEATTPEQEYDGRSEDEKLQVALDAAGLGKVETASEGSGEAEEEDDPFGSEAVGSEEQEQPSESSF